MYGLIRELLQQQPSGRCVRQAGRQLIDHILAEVEQIARQHRTEGGDH
jgi:ribosomal protein S19E (S16A)